MIGEAPGEVEDLTGLPFQGEAGRVFNYCLSRCTTSFSFEITNLLGCRPTKHNNWGSIVNRGPESKEITECLPRVRMLQEEIDYDGIVCLGVLAAKYIESSLPVLHLVHPSYILRKEYKLYDIKKFAQKLDNYVKTNFDSKG